MDYHFTLGWATWISNSVISFGFPWLMLLQQSDTHCNRQFNECFCLRKVGVLALKVSYKCGNFRCQNLIRKKDRRRWVGAKIPSSSFTGTTSSVQMTNDVQLLTKASSSTTSIVKGSFFLWQELTNDLWVLTLQFDDFLLKPRIDYLPSCVLSRCYWTTSSSLVHITELLGSNSAAVLI